MESSICMAVNVTNLALNFKTINMKKTITFLLGIILTGTALKAQWTEVGGPWGFSAGQAFWLSTDFDGTTPYAAYRDCANGCSPTVMQFNGTSWQNVGTAGITGAGSDYVSIAVANSVPYIAFADGSNSNKLAVMKYASGSWTYVGTSLSAGAITGAAMVNDPANNALYVACFASGTGSLSIQKYSLSTQTWTTVSMSTHPALASGVVGLSVYNGELYTSAADWNTDTIVVAKRNATTGTWTNLRTHVIGAAPSKIGFDNSGNLHLAYVSYSTGVAKGAVLRRIGTNWQALGAPLSLSPDTITAPTNGMALAMDANTPYVAYGNSHNYSRLSVSKYNGSSWQLVGPAGFSMGSSPVDYHSMKVINGAVYIAYTALSPLISNLRTFMMKYDVTTGINTPNKDAAMSVYPNPANDVLHIGHVTGTVTLEILDLTGRVVMVKSNLEQQESINISEMSPGVYFARITQKNQTSVTKFIKQ